MRAPLQRGFEPQRSAFFGKAPRVGERHRVTAAQRLCTFAAIVCRKPRLRVERVAAIIRAVFPARKIDVVPALLLHPQDAARCACKVDDVITLRAFAVGAAVHAVA